MVCRAYIFRLSHHGYTIIFHNLLELLFHGIIRGVGIPMQDAEFHLIIDSVKNITAAVMEKDATASKINIEYDIIYELRNIGEKCLIIRQTIKSKATFDSKSAGYSFGSDLSEKETSVKTLHSNIDEFFNAIKYSKINFSCKNEN